MPGWVMILIGLTIIYFLAWCVAFGNAWLDCEDTEMSDRERKEYMHNEARYALLCITVALVAGGILLTALFFLINGVFAITE